MNKFLKESLLFGLTIFILYVLVVVTKYNLDKTWLAMVFGFLCLLGTRVILDDMIKLLNKLDNTKGK